VKNHEIKFVLRLQNEGKATAATLGFDPKQMAAALRAANGIAATQRTSSRDQIAANTAELRARQQTERLRRMELQTAGAQARAAQGLSRAETTAAIGQQRIRRETARTEVQGRTDAERVNRAVLSTDMQRQRLSEGERRNADAAAIRYQRSQRATLLTQQAAVRLGAVAAQTQQRTALNNQRLQNSQLQGQRASVSLARQQLSLQVAQQRAIRSVFGSRGGGNGGFRNSGGGLGSLIGQAASAVGAATIVKMADEYRNLGARISLATKSEEEHALVQKKLIGLALETRTSLKGTVDLYYSLARNNKALGLSQNEMIRLTRIVNQSIVISGQSGQAAAYGLIQLGQAFGRGQLRGDELNSVLEQMPALANAIAEHFHTVPGALQNMAKKGKISAQELVKAIFEAEVKMGQDFKKFPVTVGQGLQNLKTGFQVFLGEFDKASGATKGLGNLLANLGHSLTDPAFIRSAVNFGNTFGKVIMDVSHVVGQAFRFIRDHLDEIKLGFEILSSVMVGVFAGVAAAKTIQTVLVMIQTFRTLIMVLALSQAGFVAVGLATTVMLGVWGIAIGLIATLVAGIAWLAINSTEAAKTAKAHKEAVAELTPILVGVQTELDKARMATDALRDAHLNAADAAFAQGEAELDAAKKGLQAAKTAAAAYDAKENMRIANMANLGGDPMAVALAATTAQNTVNRAVEDATRKLKAAEDVLVENGYGRRQGSRGLGTTFHVIKPSDKFKAEQAQDNILDAHPPKMDMPKPDPKAKKDGWVELLHQIDRAMEQVERHKNAMALLNKHVKEGSAEWLIYKKAIERVYGFETTPVGKMNKDLEEQAPLLDILNSKERERAAEIIKLQKDMEDFDPHGRYKAETEITLEKVRQALALKDEKELRNEILNQQQEALDTARQEYSQQFMSSEQAEVEKELQKYILQYKQLGLGYTEEEIRQKLQLLGITQQLQEAERLKKLADREPVLGAAKAVRQYFEDAQNLGVQTADVVTNAFQGLENMFVDFAMTGKMAFADFARSVVADVLRMIAKMLIMQAVLTALNFIPGGRALLAILDVGSSVGRAASAARAPGQFLDVHKTHSGGIVGRPTAFSSMASASLFGDARRMHTGGLVGGEVPIIAKKGEVVMPTVRLPDGSYGVKAVGGGGQGPITVSPQINVEVNFHGGAGQSSPDQARAAGGEIGRAVDNAMNDWAIRNSRPGGLFYKLR
jgi:lambda family phage tail tape measure protein